MVELTEFGRSWRFAPFVGCERSDLLAVIGG